jgi:hypothetical protein
MRTSQADVIGMAMCRTHTGSRASGPGRHSEYSQ